MKFITYNENFEIQLIHNMPFDNKNGLGKTKEELLEIGALVEEIPQVEVPSDKQIIYKYNKLENSVIYELIERPLTVEEQQTKDIDVLKESSKTQNEMIDICLLATDEIYMMIEPLLSINTFNVKGGSKMVDMYVAMVIRGLKTIDQVPVRYREEVRKILETLEK